MPHGWDNFYYLIGSAAAGLIGLLFVVATLTGAGDHPQSQRGIRLYMTPNIIHFTGVLTMSAAALAPGLDPPTLALIVRIVALLGLAFAVQACVGIARPRKGMTRPHWSDVWLYGVAPTVVYASLAGATAAFGTRSAWTAYTVAGLLLALLLLGIRNAWDLVTWLAPRRNGQSGS